MNESEERIRAAARDSCGSTRGVTSDLMISLEPHSQAYDSTKKGFWTSVNVQPQKEDTYKTQDDTILEREVALVPELLNVAIHPIIVLF